MQNMVQDVLKEVSLGTFLYISFVLYIEKEKNYTYIFIARL